MLATIEKVANDGVDAERVEAILRQIELHQREVRVMVCPTAWPDAARAGAATHYGDAVAALDLEPVIAKLREQVKAADYIPNLIRQCLLDNPHRVRLVVAPDPALAARREASRRAPRRNERQASGEHTAEILDLAARLRERQSQKDDPTILPRVALSDIPAETPSPLPDIAEGERTHYRYTGTNGLRTNNGSAHCRP